MADPARRGSLLAFLTGGGRAKTVEAAVSVYGKLPMYKDFLKSSVTSKEAQAYRQWLDRGISHSWGATAPYAGTPILPHAFLLRFPGTGRRVIGYLVGSHDEGGLRFFPFSVFVSLPDANEVFPSLATLDLLDQFVAVGRRLHQETRALASPDDFYRWSRELSATLVTRPEAEVAEQVVGDLMTTTLGDFATALWGEDGRVRWVQLLDYLRRNQAGASGRPDLPGLALRLPTAAPGPSLTRQLQLLCSLLAAGAGRREAPANLLVPVAEERGGFVVIQRPLRADDVFVFHPEMPGYEFVEDLRQRVPAGRDAAAVGEDGDWQRPLATIVDGRS